ncbi:MAG: hypothetical protein M0Q27_03395 [Candidatus Colwellbacteria bacterium]|nr:hypothetical protein [Candidatus Colwellbacteria bacterium]
MGKKRPKILISPSNLTGYTCEFLDSEDFLPITPLFLAAESLFGFDEQTLISSQKSAYVCVARDICMAALYCLGYRPARIGRIFGGRGYETVLRAIGRCKKDSTCNSLLEQLLEKYKEKSENYYYF